MCCAPKAFIACVEGPSFFLNLLSAFYFFYSRSGDHPRGEWKNEGDSTEAMNALGGQHIEDAFFSSRRPFEWDTCSFFFSH